MLDLDHYIIFADKDVRERPRFAANRSEPQPSSHFGRIADLGQNPHL
jgi:hypothetical protein